MKILVMLGNIGGLIATWSYLSWDGPDFRIGNGLNLATSCSILIVSLVTLVWMKRDNKKRDEKVAQGMVVSYGGIGKLDWRHPDFRWAI